MDHQHITTIKKTVSFPLSIQFSDSSLLTVPLSSLSCSVVPVGTTIPIIATVTNTTHPEVYTIHCSPVARGRHQVNVQVNDVKVGSISLMISLNPHLDNITPVRTIPELNQPLGVAMTIVRNIYKFIGPFGVAVTDDRLIIVSERDSHRVTDLIRVGLRDRLSKSSYPDIHS